MKTQVTQVKNLLTGKKEIFVNDKSLTENIINSIIVSKRQTSNLLNEKTREQYRSEIIEKTSKLTGRKFAYSIKYDLHASFEK